MARRKRPRGDLASATLGELITRDARVLALLEKHGITFCAGCYLTLFATPERAAMYHAVSEPKKFLQDLERTLR